jgi:hypothetical protein
MERVRTMTVETITTWTPPHDTGASWHDYEDIRQLITGYCVVVDSAMNAGNPPEVGALFHTDSTFGTSFEDRMYVGGEAVAAWYRRYLGSRATFYRWMRHKVFDSFIQVDGDHATAVTYFDADSVNPKDRIGLMSGRYEDEFRKDQGRWLFSKRFVAIDYVHHGGDAWKFAGWPGMQEASE